MTVQGITRPGDEVLVQDVRYLVTALRWNREEEALTIEAVVAGGAHDPREPGVVPGYPVDRDGHRIEP